MLCPRSLLSLGRPAPQLPSSLFPLLSRPFVLPYAILLALSSVYATLGSYGIAAGNAMANLTGSKLSAASGASLFFLATFTLAVFSPASGGTIEAYPRYALLCGLMLGGLIGVIAADYFVMRRWRLPTEYLYKTRPRLHLCGLNSAAVLALLVSYGASAAPWAVHRYTRSAHTHLGLPPTPTMCPKAAGP